MDLHPDSGRVREKLRWLADYHNYVCTEFYAPEGLDYLVDRGPTDIDRLFPRVFRRLVPGPDA